jgi:hypothetical protein
MLLKMKLPFFSCFILIFLLSGCAWNKDGLRPDFENEEDMLESFEVPENLSKFKKIPQEVEIPPVSEVPEEDKKVEVTKKKAPKKPKPLVKKASTKLPDDYPPEFLEYDKNYKRYWKDFNPRVYPGEETEIDIQYLGVTAGKVLLVTRKDKMVGEVEVYHFYAKLKSAPFYSFIYSLEDVVQVYVDQKRFLPLRYELIQRESKQDVDDLQIFDLEERKTYHWYKRIKEGKTTEKEITAYTPEFFLDSFSALFFVRGLPLIQGDTYEFPVITRGKLWLINLKVSGVETISIQNKDYQAIRIEAETRFPGALSKKGNVTFWYENNERRNILKFQAEVKIGTVSGVMSRHKDGTLDE